MLDFQQQSRGKAAGLRLNAKFLTAGRTRTRERIMIAAMILARQRWTCFSLLLLLFGFGVSIRFTNYQIAYIGLALTALIFLIRIPAVYIGFGRTTCVRDASLAAIMSPKDLAAVVLASMPRERQLPGGETVQSVTYGIVFLSIVFTSCSVS